MPISRLSPLVAVELQHSPELRLIRVLLPERFIALATCSFGGVYTRSPRTIIRPRISWYYSVFNVLEVKIFLLVYILTLNTLKRQTFFKSPSQTNVCIRIFNIVRLLTFLLGILNTLVFGALFYLLSRLVYVLPYDKIFFCNDTDLLILLLSNFEQLVG